MRIYSFFDLFKFSQIILIIACLTHVATSIRFFCAPGIKKCLKEEIHKNVLVTGEYELQEAPGQKTHIKVWKLLSCFYVLHISRNCISSVMR